MKDYSPQCTHIITPSLAGSPKCLAAIVSGKWLLKESWLRECEKQGQFVDEKPHEWKEQDVEKNEVKSLVKGIPLCKEKLHKVKGGLFANINAICILDEQSQGWKTILEAGGATVRLQATLSESDLKVSFLY